MPFGERSCHSVLFAGNSPAQVGCMELPLRPREIRLHGLVRLFLAYTIHAPHSFFVTAHDSTVSVANGPNDVQVVPTLCLPFVTLVFLSETQIVAAGHDCAPYLISNRNGVWTLVDKIDQGTKKAALTSSNTAFNKFKLMDSRAQSATTTDTEITSVHQNAIT